MQPRTTCPDCEGTLTPISVRDHTSHAAVISPPHYELPEAKQPWWSSAKPVAGTIHALMCAECGRVLFYAEPKEKKP